MVGMRGLRGVQRHCDRSKRAGTQQLGTEAAAYTGKIFALNQVPNLIATNSMMHRTSYIDREIDPGLSLLAGQKEDTNAMWMLERRREFPGTADESSLLKNGSPTSRSTLRSHQKAQSGMSTGAEGFIPLLLLIEARGAPASVRVFVTTVPQAFTDLFSTVGEKARRKLLHSDLVHHIWST